MSNYNDSVNEINVDFKSLKNGDAYLKKLHKDLNIDPAHNYLSNFDRAYSVYPDRELDSVCQYVIMVRPDLNLFEGNGISNLETPNRSLVKNNAGPASYPYIDRMLRYMHTNHNQILEHLTLNGPWNHDFMPYLVGRTESLQIPDFSLSEYSLKQPYTNMTFPYAGYNYESQTGGQFDISFREDNNLRLHKLFQVWVYYIDCVTRNIFAPKTKYIQMNRIDYATSVYLITCKSDGESIIYWSKYTGAFPTSVPNSDTSFNLRGSAPQKISIPFSYMYTESMNPWILVDFNKNAHVYAANSENYIPIYNSNTMSDYSLPPDMKVDSSMLSVIGTTNGMVGAPFVYLDSATHEYKLRWKRTTYKRPTKKKKKK